MNIMSKENISFCGRFQQHEIAAFPAISAWEGKKEAIVKTR